MRAITASAVLAFVACSAPAVDAPVRSPPASPPAPPSPPPPDASSAVAQELEWRQEPDAPDYECVFTRNVVCRPGSPVRKALQPPPFADCPPVIAATLPVVKAQFSPAETTRARSDPSTPDVCCYIEFTTQQCR